MRREWTVVVLVGAVLATGCVSNKKYQAALTEADNAKMELEKARQQKSAMEQQVRTLKELNVKFGNEAQAVRDDERRIDLSVFDAQGRCILKTDTLRRSLVCWLLVLQGAVKVLKRSESGREIVLYRVERGETERF